MHYRPHSQNSWMFVKFTHAQARISSPKLSSLLLATLDMLSIKVALSAHTGLISADVLKHPPPTLEHRFLRPPYKGINRSNRRIYRGLRVVYTVSSTALMVRSAFASAVWCSGSPPPLCSPEQPDLPMPHHRISVPARSTGLPEPTRVPVLKPGSGSRLK